MSFKHKWSVTDTKSHTAGGRENVVHTLSWKLVTSLGDDEIITTGKTGLVYIPSPSGMDFIDLENLDQETLLEWLTINLNNPPEVFVVTGSKVAGERMVKDRTNPTLDSIQASAETRLNNKLRQTAST